MVNASPWTALEDRMLHEELAGYAEHAAKVRYRLFLSFISSIGPPSKSIFGKRRILAFVFCR